MTEVLAGDGIDPTERTPRSFHVSRHLLERARAAAHWLGRMRTDTPPGGEPGNDPAEPAKEPSNLSELVERALRREVERLEGVYNAGRPFPAVVGRMRSGPGPTGAARISRAQRARHHSPQPE